MTSEPLRQHPGCILRFQAEQTTRPMPMIAFTRILMDHHLGTGAAKGIGGGSPCPPASGEGPPGGQPNPVDVRLDWVKAPIHDARMVRSKVSFSSPPRRLPPQQLPRRSELDALRAARKAEARALASGDRAAPEQSPTMPHRRSEERRDMTPRRLWITALLVAGFLSGGPARSAEPHWPETLMLATASPGGTYHAYGAGLARILTRVLGIAVSNSGDGRTEREHTADRGRRSAD